ncbi:PQQ-dependent sugar dehydrogenase [Occultella kanbiaonis]|uniref:PQQ-dependent sugar dehydrogenase n=1 Tax=Occultella kanbiaonis TaxID=2675754 RepID=UPI0012B8883B|nr:PQQ-dependent sugar dehydrogenase [Occultella kanbiaonis]
MRRTIRPPRSVRPARALLIAATLALAAGCTADPEGGPVPEPSATTPAGSTEPEPTTAEPDGPTETTPPPSGPPAEITDVRVGATIATGLQTPWGVAFAPDGSALVTERDSGRVLRVTDDGVTALDAGGSGGAVPDVAHGGEGGLLGIAVGPDGGVYLYLTTSADNRVIRMDLDGDALVDPRVVLDGIPAAGNHNGGRLAFGPDGFLYVSTGDAGRTSRAQDLDSLGGKILRLTTTGEPAPGNPFGTEVYSYGHRNVQGLGWTSDGRLYASEFGQNNLDELNIITPGGNYGWPQVEGWAGTGEYLDPVVTWPTSEASPSGIAVTDAGVWLAALRGERLWYVPITPDGVGEPSSYLDLGRLRAVTLTPDGELWVATSNTDGRGEVRDGDDRIVELDVS